MAPRFDGGRALTALARMGNVIFHPCHSATVTATRELIVDVRWNERGCRDRMALTYLESYGNMPDNLPGRTI